MDILLIILGSFIVWVWGIYLGWQAREMHAKRILAKILEENLESDLEEKPDNVKKNQLPIKIEKYDEGYFVYGLNTNEFMAQGKTRWHLEQALEKRYPGKQFAASADNLREVGFVDVSNTK